LSLVDVLIDLNLYITWDQSILNAINGIAADRMRQYGARIWIHLEWEVCQSERCLLTRRYDWQTRSIWHKCTEGIEDDGLRGIGFGGVMTPEQIRAKTFEFIPNCIRAAIAEAGL
jgi:hypothetical protein